MTYAVPKHRFTSLNHCLFQAAMWRRYAMEWNLPSWNDRRRRVETHLKVSRAECLAKAFEAVRAARDFHHLIKAGSNNAT